MLNISGEEFEAMLTEKEIKRMNRMLVKLLEFSENNDVNISYRANETVLVVVALFDGNEVMTLHFESEPKLSKTSLDLLKRKREVTK